MRLEIIPPHCVVEFPAQMRFNFVALADEDAVFRQMREEYCARRIKYNGCMLALNLCSTGFGIPIHVLQGRDRSGTLGATRAKLMAFSRIVSLDGMAVNTWMGVGRAFHRTHSNVVYCVNRYGPQIVAALEHSK